MEQIGKVIELKDKMAVVLVKRGGMCGENCSSCSGCSFTEQKALVKNELSAKVGNTVKIEMPTSVVMWSAFVIYIVPIIFLLLGYSLVGFPFAFLFFFVPFIIILFLNKKLNKKILGKIVKIID